MPRNISPSHLYARNDGFYVTFQDKIMKFRGDYKSSKNPIIEIGSYFEYSMATIDARKDVLGSTECQSGWIVLRKNNRDYSFNFYSTTGQIQREINLSDYFEEDFLQEQMITKSQVLVITITATNMDFLAKFVNIDASPWLIDKEIILFSTGSSLNVLLKNQEDEWDISMIQSYPQEIKCLWYSENYNCLCIMTSFSVLKVSYLEDNHFREENIYLGKKYSNEPKLLRADELIGISWTSIEILNLVKEETFKLVSEKIPLAGVVDGIFHSKWECYLAVSESGFFYVFSKRDKPPEEEKIRDKWRRNRGKFRKYITKLMEGTSKIVAENKQDSDILNCLGFLKNFFVITHEVSIEICIRPSLDNNVELKISPSQNIVQMDFSRESQFSISVFNNIFRQKFSLKPNTDTYAFMLPEKLLMDSPLRIDVSAEFSLNEEHFCMAFPLRVSFVVEEASPGSPLINFYSKLEALEKTSVEEYANQWTHIEQLNEKKLSKLAVNLHRMVLSEKMPSKSQLLVLFKELRSKEDGI